jgi:hypothetical protein
LREIKVLYEKLWVGRGKNKGIGGRNPNIRDVVANKVGILKLLARKFTKSPFVREYIATK